jgi:LPS-assembly protein
MNKRLTLLILFLIISFNKIISLKANDDTYINSSNIIYNEKMNVIELADNSKINFKNTNILIDKGIIDYNQDKFEVFGNFYLYEDLTILSGQNLKGSTNLEIFSANNVSYIYNDDLKIDSDKLNREENLVYFYNNFLTPCELNGYFNCPTWSLRIDKTEYNLKQDKFTHFDTFLQIADYKIFYLPYFSHYGAKAPRKKGFLTPTLQFTVGGGQGVIIPYYFPINPSTDILFKPKISLNENFEVLEKYQLNTLINNKRSGGITTISIDNIKNVDDININNSIRIDTKQVISKKKVISASGLFTNSISTTRSINEDPTTFEDIFLRSENYDILKSNDYSKIELSSVESFESNKINSIPISPSLNYYNNLNFNNYSLINLFDFTILKRNESATNIPSESFKLKFNSELINNYFTNNISIYNKIIFNNSINDYYFNKNENLNHKSNKSYISLSSDINILKSALLAPRLKIIYPLQLVNSNKEINEDSESITFNYQNQFSENRFFGNDLFDTSPRIVYAVESSYELSNNELNFNISQSYENTSENSYLDKINQKSKFSDYAIEAKLNIDNFLFKIDSRLAQSNLSKKEMNYSINFEDQINLSLNYNETQSEAFKNQSDDTQSINFSITKKLNDNINLGYSSDLDVKNNYDPYKSSLQISLFDECSQLDLTYSNTRFNDNFNTHPEETISLTFKMEYLGFFGYEQATNLFFSEPGNVNYGL